MKLLFKRKGGRSTGLLLGGQREKVRCRVSLIKNHIVLEHLVLLQGGLGPRGELAAPAHPGAVGVPEANGIDHRHRLAQLIQKLLVAGLGQVGGLGQQSGQVVEGQLHPLGLRDVVVGPDDEGHRLAVSQVSSLPPSILV